VQPDAVPGLTGADQTRTLFPPLKMTEQSVDVTSLIQRAVQGDAEAADRLFALTYKELIRLARRRLASGGRNTLLDTASLVHESYLRFANAGSLRIVDRHHFLGWAGRVMRSVIVDLARRRSAVRRGGAGARVTLTTGIVDGRSGSADEILRVHEALEGLAGLDPRLAQVVELRYFGGLTESEIAQVLGVTDRTVRRDWEKARLLLREALD
jgi:RNA polymerase sigma factor (TIGR02999 family)